MIWTEPVTIAVGGLGAARNARTASAPWLAEDGGPSLTRWDSGGRPTSAMASWNPARRADAVEMSLGAADVTDALMAKFEQVRCGGMDDSVVVDAEPVRTQRRHAPQ